MRSILITGATGMIGQAFVKHFLDIGDTVIGVSRSQIFPGNLKNSLNHLPGTFHALSLDLTKENAASSLLEALKQYNLYPDCLINNARNVSYLAVEGDGSIARDNFIGEFTLDVVVPYELTVALLNDPKSRLKSVVNIGSQYGVVAPNLSLYKDPIRESPLHYGVAKAALSHLTKELAVRYAKRKLRVNCVAFGGVEGRAGDAFKERYAELCPMGRMLKESELAAPVDILLSDSSSAITGITLVVDCGWSLW